MQLKIFEVNKQKIAEIISEEIVINDAQDALDIMANANYQGAESIILHQKNLTPAFFELQTGIAGEILQKHVNYHMKLAIIGEFEKFKSGSLKAFITESNRGKLAFFVPNRQSAIAKITG